MFEIQNVALTSGLLPDFIQMKAPGFKMAPSQWVLGLNHRST